MKTSRLAKINPRESSFALISVLALVSLAALSATAFLASARLDRLAGRPLADVARLEMALSSGQSLAISTLQLARGENYSRIVTYWRTNETNDLGYLLVGSPDASNPSVIYYPLFSVAQMSNVLNPSTTNVLTTLTTNIARQGEFRMGASNFIRNLTSGLAATNLTSIQLLGHTATNPRTSPPVAWITLTQNRRRPGTTNETSEPVVRLAYFVEDLQGLIDVERMGGMTNRGTGTNPMEIALSNATGTLFAANPGATNSNNRVKYLTPGMVLSVNGLTNSNDAAQLRYFATGLRSWGPYSYLSGGNLVNDSTNTNGFFSRIPYAVQVGPNNRCYSSFIGNLTNYLMPIYSANPSNPTFLLHRRLNLNALLQSNSNNPAQAVSLLASALTNQLPEFTNRAGAMDGSVYLSNIAANIVDFVDSNTNPTVDPSAIPPRWRGAEAIPWPNEIFTKFNLQSRNIVGANFEFKLSVQQFIEVWNLSSKEVSMPSGSLAISNNMNIQLQCSNWFGNLATVDPANPPMVETATNASVSLPPNSYAVVSANPRVLTINVPTNLAPSTNPSLSINRAQPSPNTNNRYVAFFSNVPVDASPGGRILGITTNMRVGDFHFICSAAGFGSSQGGAVYNLAGGDPRAQLFVSQPTMAIDYSASTPGGRNRYSPASGGANIVDPRLNWPDGGHSLGNSGADLVTSPANANANSTMAQGLTRQGNTNHWIQKTADSGSLGQLSELGNIFDPIQWGDPNNPFHPRDSAAWMVLSSSCTNFAGAGGRNTLRIGRPEHPRFAFTNFGGDAVPNMGMSAVALLDLFALNNDAEDFGGRINLNTAPAPVLAALAGGVALTNDPVRAPSTAPINATMVGAFTQGVLKFRQIYPFHTSSQMAFISTDYGVGAWTNTWTNTAVFGTNQSSASTNGLAGITALNDAGREEWFSKIHRLAAVDSWNYRCYVVAQLLNTNGTPRGAVTRKYYQIYTRPNPNQANNFSTVVTFESSY
jgi:hypothetical protein